MKLWIVGHLIPGDPVWKFGGVFDDEKLAVVACKDRYYFVGPATLNEELPPEVESWPEAYYPILEGRKT